MGAERDLLDRLLKSPLDYRAALGILDHEYREWRPEGKPEHRLEFVGGVPLLSFPVKEQPNFWNGTCYVLGQPPEAEAPRVAEAVRARGVNEVDVLGESAFQVLRPYLTEGTWRLTRQYGLVAGGLRTRPSPAVRKLTVGDRPAVDEACERQRGTGEKRSTQRDFEYMLRGLPVTCYSAFEGGDIVGFCSASPICRGVTEISWLFVEEQHRRRGLASGMLTAQAEEAFARGDMVGYYAGWETTSPWLDGMLRKRGFRELLGCYRFIPLSCQEKWRHWGREV